MYLYSRIINPKTGRKILTKSRLGKKILRKYVIAMSGGEPTPKSKKAKLPDLPDSDSDTDEEPEMLPVRNPSAVSRRRASAFVRPMEADTGDDIVLPARIPRDAAVITAHASADEELWRKFREMMDEAFGHSYGLYFKSADETTDKDKSRAKINFKRDFLRAMRDRCEPLLAEAATIASYKKLAADEALSAAISTSKADHKRSLIRDRERDREIDTLQDEIRAAEAKNKLAGELGNRLLNENKRVKSDLARLVTDNARLNRLHESCERDVVKMGEVINKKNSTIQKIRTDHRLIIKNQERKLNTKFRTALKHHDNIVNAAETEPPHQVIIARETAYRGLVEEIQLVIKNIYAIE